MSETCRIGMDIGGTFTDYVLIDSQNRLHLHKRLTTPGNPARGALAGLDELLQRSGFSLAQVEHIVHGTTLVTNAIIERQGARTALLTTRGFRDILEMGFEQRYDIYDLFLPYPEPLVPRAWRLEVDERITRDGEVLQSPDLAVVQQQVAQLVDQGLEALAIGFLHSYRNPIHEQQVARQIRQAFPQLSVSVSSEIVPEIREYERFNTTVANAYVQPLMNRYLDELTQVLTRQGFTGHFLLMQSSGGSATVEVARRFPIRFLESGPAGGALVTRFMGQQLNAPDLIAFDMGGTTAKASLIRDYQPEVAPLMEAARVHRFKPGSGLPVKAPVIDLIEIGAGGGSIAQLDSLGLLKVGPRSAGADPGPACYGLGGTFPTVTDAALILGYFDPGYFLGGTMTLSLEAARTAYQPLAQQLGVSVEEAAWGVYRIVCENMAQAARVHIIEKGHDPRRYSMMAFGGAGPAHAARVARILGSPEVLIPRVSGVASALGFLVAPLSFEFSRSYPTELRQADWAEVDHLYQQLEAQAHQVLQEAGVPLQQIRLERRADMRFSGQFHDLEVEVPNGPVEASLAPLLAQRFEEAYARLYHSVLPGYQPMVLNWRLRAVGPELQLDLEQPTTPQASAEGACKGRRLVYYPEAGGPIEVPVYDRYRLQPGMELAGPAIVEEHESTTVVGVSDQVGVDHLGNLRIKVVVS